MHRLLGAIGTAGALIVTVPASAQSALAGRVDRLEGEMRAVQRKVFPGGDLVQPDIAPPPPSPSSIGAPANTPLTDVLSRITALEQQMATLTGQVEQADYRTRQLQRAFDAYKQQTDVRLKTMENGGPRAAAVDQGAAVNASSDRGEESSVESPAMRGDRAAQVAAVERPSTGDVAEDAYLYGYRLWQAKLYPEAETQLKKVVSTYPKSRRASFAQNLLGRAYLDEGKPSLASIAFYDNYKKMPDGERAPDSLNYLAQALITLKKPADACKVYGELTDMYGAKLPASMRDEIDRGRATAKCK